MCDLKYMDKDMDNKSRLFFYPYIYIYIYILDEAINSQTTRQRDGQAVRKQIFHRTDTLQADPIKHEDNDCF